MSVTAMGFVQEPPVSDKQNSYAARADAVACAPRQGACRQHFFVSGEAAVLARDAEHHVLGPRTS